jgi:hypothetical protein
MAAQVPVLRLTQARRLGGSAETEHTAVAVMPRRSFPWRAVMMVTAPGNRAMAARKVA